MKELKHVAIIMDGNGRWAKRKGHPRIWGHVRGSFNVSKIVEASDECGLKSLTLYAFSTENWSRPKKEISVLFQLLKKFVKRERTNLIEKNVRFRCMGTLEALPKHISLEVEQLQLDTAHLTGLTLTVAFDYGGRNEIINACSRILENKENVSLPLTEESFSQYLCYKDLHNIDLLIRTGGVFRISNFLLWQIAYAELFFTQTAWPEFSVNEFKDILNTVQGRERRFGNINSTGSYEDTKQKALENRRNISNLGNIHV